MDLTALIGNPSAPTFSSPVALLHLYLKPRPGTAKTPVGVCVCACMFFTRVHREGFSPVQGFVESAAPQSTVLKPGSVTRPFLRRSLSVPVLKRWIRLFSYRSGW